MVLSPSPLVVSLIKDPLKCTLLFSCLELVRVHFGYPSFLIPAYARDLVFIFSLAKYKNI